MKRASLVCTGASLYSSTVAAACFAAGVRELVVCHPDSVTLEKVKPSPCGTRWRACLFCGTEYLPKSGREASVADYDDQIACELSETEKIEARLQIECEKQHSHIVIGRFGSELDSVEQVSAREVFKTICNGAATSTEVDKLIFDMEQAGRARHDELNLKIRMAARPVTGKITAKPITILYAEDDSAVRNIVADSLEEEGWTVQVCADGTGARERIAGDEWYDLFLFDNELPGASGLDLARQVRSLARRSSVPIIMLSGSNAAKEATAAGVDLFLEKPDGVLNVVANIYSLIDFAQHA